MTFLNVKSTLRKKLAMHVAAGCFLALTPTLVQAQEIIEQIVINGAQRIEPETVRSYMVLQEGERFDTSKLNSSLKKLFATGLFADVTFRKEAGNLVVNVVENPVINRIAFEGNRKLDDETLSAEVTLRPRVIYTRTRVQEDVERILSLYRRSGRFAATVEPKVIQLDQNRVDLAFEIVEGDNTGIEKIRFVGNEEYSDGKLRDIVRTRESRWYNFFTADDNYDPDRLAFDKELLRRYYNSRGFADFKVTSAVAELSPDRESFFITYTIDEGPRYEIGSVNIDNRLDGLDEAIVKDVISIDPDDWYNADDVEYTQEDVVDVVSNAGFPFVKVSPEIKRDTENRKIDLTYKIEEGPRVFVERINIEGNFRTLDKVVRREFQLVEGDALNAAKLKRSEKRINDLNFFEKVEITQEPGSAPDQQVVNVYVEEKSTGSLSIGAGFSSSSGPIVETGIVENNLLGRGQRLGLSGSLAGESSTLNLSFTEPYFMNREVAAGFNLFHVTEDSQDESSYDLARTGLSLRASYPLSEYLRQSFSYLIDETTIENVDSSASTLISSQEGTEITSQVSHSLTYDRRDSKLNPSEGYVVSLTNSVAGIGGTIFNFANQVSGSYYYPLEDQWVVNISGRAGHIMGWNDEEVKIQNRYFLGGNNLRGFESSGVGPRDRITKDALGGEYVFNGTTALKFPLGLPNEYQISGSVFTDFGTVAEINPSNSNVVDSESLRASAGIGFAWISPMGPIGIDYAVPYLKESEDKTEYFRFSFGTSF